MNKQEYEAMRDIAEAELERRIDKSLYYQGLLDNDTEYQAWLDSIQKANREYQENHDAS